jgi:hypothetical protein
MNRSCCTPVTVDATGPRKEARGKNPYVNPALKVDFEGFVLDAKGEVDAYAFLDDSEAGKAMVNSI